MVIFASHAPWSPYLANLDRPCLVRPTASSRLTARAPGRWTTSHTVQVKPLACHCTPSRTGAFDHPQLCPFLSFSLAPLDCVSNRDFVICTPFIYLTCLCTRFSNIGTPALLAKSNYFLPLAHSKPVLSELSQHRRKGDPGGNADLPGYLPSER